MAIAVCKPFLALSVAALLLAGCASPGRYPSLAIRDAERAAGTMQPAEPEPYVPPATPPETLDRIASLVAEGQAAHQAFLASAERARGPARAAAGAADGSERWAVAEVALADVQANRSRTMIALAELDRLYVDAELAGRALEPITTARDQIAALVATEDQTMETLRGGR